MPASRLLSAIAVAILASGCASHGTYLDIGAGVDVNSYGFRGENPVAYIAAGIDRGTYRCEWQHVSHWLVGWPFGPVHEEDWIDQIACVKRIQFDT